ncbi:hypothetical protein [Streptomyces javensis]|uniref:Uncharacterized protein n=2 Tax=Streptomyces javensis TaxID=114698 RepID=A0ABS0R2P3_9ACTN|nr:hypothetical protein [Streptomyces javensis]MBI0311631.1 hypothetical protein [Streptomyces javensis]
MAGAFGRAVQVRRIGAAWQDGEAGLLILPGETVEYDGERMQIASRQAAAGSARRTATPLCDGPFDMASRGPVRW